MRCTLAPLETKCYTLAEDFGGRSRGALSLKGYQWVTQHARSDLGGTDASTVLQVYRLNMWTDARDQPPLISSRLMSNL